MTSREKTLIGAVAATGLLWFGAQGLARYREKVTQSKNQQTAAEQALSEARVAQLRGARARKRLNDWRAQSLPTNQEIAESLYQDWLRAQLAGAGMNVVQLTDKSGSAKNPQFGEVTVAGKAEGSLAQLTDFLHRFYAGPHLHRLSSSTIAASEGGQKLTFDFVAAALILPETKRTDALAEGDPRPIEGVKSLEDVRTRLVDRNLFVAQAPKANEGAVDNNAADAEVTATVGGSYGDQGWQLWVRHKKSGQVSRFLRGDAIQFGSFKGKVVEIDNRRIVVETDKGRMEFRAGQNFTQGTLLAPPAA